MTQPTELQARLAAQSGRALAAWLVKVEGEHRRVRKWPVTVIERPEPLVPLAIVRGEGARNAVYVGDAPAHVGDDLPDAVIAQILQVHLARAEAERAQARHQLLQAEVARDLILQAWTFRNAAAALGVTNGRIVQIVGAGVTPRKPKSVRS